MMSQFSYNNKEYEDESDPGDFLFVFKNSKKAAHHQCSETNLHSGLKVPSSSSCGQ